MAPAAAAAAAAAPTSLLKLVKDDTALFINVLLAAGGGGMLPLVPFDFPSYSPILIVGGESAGDLGKGPAQHYAV